MSSTDSRSLYGMITTSSAALSDWPSCDVTGVGESDGPEASTGALTLTSRPSWLPW